MGLHIDSFSNNFPMNSGNQHQPSSIIIIIFINNSWSITKAYVSPRHSDEDPYIPCRYYLQQLTPPPPHFSNNFPMNSGNQHQPSSIIIIIFINNNWSITKAYVNSTVRSFGKILASSFAYTPIEFSGF